MYELTLVLHSVLRWLVILFAVLALARASSGWLGRKAWLPGDASALRWLVAAVNVQFLVGLLLWGLLSPFGVASFGDMATTMREPTRRFWAVEHVAIMFVAVALVHIGAARARRAATDLARHRTAAIFILIATVLVLVGIPWAGVNARPWFRWPF